MSSYIALKTQDARDRAWIHRSTMERVVGVCTPTQDDGKRSDGASALAWSIGSVIFLKRTWRLSSSPTTTRETRLQLPLVMRPGHVRTTWTHRAEPTKERIGRMERSQSPAKTSNTETGVADAGRDQEMSTDARPGYRSLPMPALTTRNQRLRTTTTSSRRTTTKREARIEATTWKTSIEDAMISRMRNRHCHQGSDVDHSSVGTT